MGPREGRRKVGSRYLRLHTKVSVVLRLLSTLPAAPVVSQIDGGEVGGDDEQYPNTNERLDSDHVMDILPFKCAKYSCCLEGPTAAPDTGMGRGQLRVDGNEACEPEDHRDRLHGRYHQPMCKMRGPDRGGRQVWDHDEGRPTAQEDEKVDGAGGGPPAVENTDD